MNRDRIIKWLGITRDTVPWWYAQTWNDDDIYDWHYIGPDPLAIDAPESAALVGYLMEALGEEYYDLYRNEEGEWSASLVSGVRAAGKTPYAALVAAMKAAGMEQAEWWEDETDAD